MGRSEHPHALPPPRALGAHRLRAGGPARPHEGVSGRNAFLESCASCHGVDRRGTGAMAQDLDPAPTDLTTISARNDGTFRRDRVMSIIDGFNRGGRFSPAMPEFGAGDLGDTVIVNNPDGTGTPVPETLLALADYLESMQELDGSRRAGFSPPPRPLGPAHAMAG